MKYKPQWTAAAMSGLCGRCQQLCGRIRSGCSVQVEAGIFVQPCPASPPWTSQTTPDGRLLAWGGLGVESAYPCWGTSDLNSLGTWSLQVFPRALEKQKENNLNSSEKDGEKIGGIFFWPCLLSLVEAGRGPDLRHLETMILLKKCLINSV